MSVFDSVRTTPVVLRAHQPLDEAQLAAVAFLARYRGRTLESYRADLRQFFQWANDLGLPPLAATRTHIELYRSSMDERGLAASTVDRRWSTICVRLRLASRPSHHWAICADGRIVDQSVADGSFQRWRASGRGSA